MGIERWGLQDHNFAVGALEAWPSSALWRERRYSSAKIAAVAHTVAALGADPRQLLVGTGLDLSTLEDPHALTSAAQFYATLQRALVLCPHEPGLGWRIGQQMRVNRYGMYGYAMLSLPTMRAAMALAVRHHALANPLLPLRWHLSAQSLVWVFPNPDELHFPDLDLHLYRLLVLVQMATQAVLITDVMGEACRPTQLRLAWAPPDGAGTETPGLEIAPVYGAGRCEMHYSAEWLDRAPRYADAFAAAQTSRECARLQESLSGHTDVVRQVYRVLTQTPGQFPGIEEVAQRLCMSSRTLRRHLSAQGQSFGDLLDRVRRALAEDYLQGTRLAQDDIAVALGFADARSFRGAFKRWTGHAPADWRARHTH